MKVNYCNHQINFEKTEDGIRILSVSGSDPRVLLPDRIEGIPVTEIGRYAFSESSLLSLRLPFFVHTLHNGAFYNCRKLSDLSCGPKIRGIGSDVFTNCSRLGLITLRGSAGQASGLRLLLERLPDDLTVSFCPDPPASPASSPLSGEECRLFFPEYYEWLDEITPAHLFSRSIQGEGYRMRKCFTDRVFDPGKYDGCFERALLSESPRALCRIALNRLLFPYGLGAGARQSYRKELSERISTCFTLAVEKESMSLLQYICGELSPDSRDLEEAYDRARKKDWGEGCAYLTARRHALGKVKNYDIDWDL